MAARQHEAGLLVLRQAESGRLVGLEIVAAVTSVEVGCRGKLPRMLIGVTVRTALELDFEQGVLAFRNVALCALQARMRALQRVSAGGVLLHRERRWLPAIHRVAGGTLAAIRTLGELAFMRVRPVAIHALLECERLFEVSIGMALPAIHAHVLALQRVLGLRVVEAFIH